MTNKHITLLLIGLLLLILVVEGFSSRRRHRRCSRINCVWGGWSEWSSCSCPCGKSGIQSRSRDIIQQSSCGGSKCSGSGDEIQDCNRGCEHGGKEKKCDCTCDKGEAESWWGQCCEKACAPISNCKDLWCTTADNHKCKECDYTYSHKIVAYRLDDENGNDDRKCTTVCSWRPDSRYCYPGKCEDETPNSCVCAPNYDSPASNCVNILVPPDTSCVVAGTAMLNSAITNAEFDCSLNAAIQTHYTNMAMAQLYIDWSIEFKGPDIDEYPLESYISESSIGVTSASMRYWLTRRQNDETITMIDKTIDCAEGSSEDTPYTERIDLKQEVSLNDITWVHGDCLNIETSASNGGHVIVHNYDPGVDEANPPIYLNGKVASHHSALVMDFLDPEHCSLIETDCTDKMLQIREIYTQSNVVTVLWGGWLDEPAGVELYELKILPMKTYGEELDIAYPDVYSVSLNAAYRGTIATLPNPGVYCVELTVIDSAGNNQRSRRFVTFDDTNIVDISEDDKHKLWVPSATENTSFVWITTLQDDGFNGAKVHVNWSGHFFNKYHEDNKLLNSIREHNPPIEQDYQQTTGQPPHARSMEAIPNVHGVWKFQAAYTVDQDEGQTEENDLVWMDVDESLSQHTWLDISRRDGDSVRVYIKAQDVVSHQAIDTVLVHVDSSPPEMTGMALKKYGVIIEDVHNSHGELDLSLAFEAYDFHSGLKTIHWELHGKTNETIIFGSDDLAVRIHTEVDSVCNPPSCYCTGTHSRCYESHYVIEPDTEKIGITKGKHNYDYHYLITVTNNAMLQTVIKYQVPPAHWYPDSPPYWP